MTKDTLKKYIAYLFRWQLSTPVLAFVLIELSFMNKWAAVIVANLIGGLIFFWVDKFIFTSSALTQDISTLNSNIFHKKQAS